MVELSIQKLLGDDSDSLVDCEHHLWKLAVALSSALFKKYEIWSSLTVVFWVNLYIIYAGSGRRLDGRDYCR